MSSVNMNFKWAECVSNIIADMGIQRICICPGSRNTPLTLAFTKNLKFDCSSHIDERSASFFAMGISKKSNIPSVVISTSGTAVANFFPSVIEASLSKTPLIVITADRPSHLVDTGENQTINQQNIFSSYVREFEDLGLPGEQNNLDEKIRSLVDIANGGSSLPPGPVHINVPFDEPLIDDISGDTMKNSVNVERGPIQTGYPSFEAPDLDGSVIVCGQMQGRDDCEKILNLSEHLKAPVLADPTSNIRYYKNHQNIISSYNLFLKDIDFQPKNIIRFGRKPTSKLLCQILRNHDRVFYVDRYERFNDDSNYQINSDISHFADSIITGSSPIGDNENLTTMISLQEKINPFINAIHFNDYRCEGALINNILHSVDCESNIFIGNSMAIREMDDLSANLDKQINIYANRGASGIDGLVSTALGVACSDDKNVNIAILGDLSFYHDMNGLLNAKKMNLNMKFVVLNNNGGGIFSNMDIAKLNYSRFEEFWTTPLNLDFKKIADLYNLEYSQINSEADLARLNQDSQRAVILEYKIDIGESIKNKERIVEEVRALVNS